LVFARVGQSWPRWRHRILIDRPRQAHPRRSPTLFLPGSASPQSPRIDTAKSPRIDTNVSCGIPESCAPKRPAMQSSGGAGL
jgi:hypothetical protein